MTWSIEDFAFKKNIHHLYDEVRIKSPIYFCPDGPVIFSRHEDVVKILKEKHLSKDLDVHAAGASAEYIKPFVKLKESLPQMGKFKTLLRMDGEEHDVLKKVLMPMFTKNETFKLNDNIDEIVDQVLWEIKDERVIDVAEQFAKRIPVRVISKMLNIDENINEFLYEWSETLSVIIEPSMSKKDIDAIIEKGPQGFFYFIDVLSREDRGPHSNLVRDIKEKLSEENGFTFETMVSVVALLYIAGVETLTYTLTNAIHDIIKNPSEIEIIKDFDTHNVSVQNNIVEEILRYSASVYQSIRVSIKEINYTSSLGSTVIPAGTIINAVLASANRDPEVFENPHQLDLLRGDSQKHVSFSAGPHFCLGANLAKLEISSALQRFFKKYPDSTIVGEPKYRSRTAITGIQKLIIKT